MHEPTTSTTARPLSSAAAAPSFSGGASFKHSKPQQPSLYVPPGHVAFRLLCHASRVGGLIGKSGCIIKQLQQLTNCKIRVEDPVDPCDHRVISVVASPAIVNRIRIYVPSPSEGEANNGGSVDWDEGWFDVSAAQEGVVRVFERVVEVAAEGDATSAIGGMVSCRLLVWKSQAGAVIGKGGTVVEKIRKDTGCRVKVLATEKFLCASSPMDEIVEVEGNFMAVKKALVAITSRLQEFMPSEKSQMYGSRTIVAESLPISNLDLPLQQSYLPRPMLSSSSVSHVSGRSSLPLDSDKVFTTDYRMPQLEVVFKILCPIEKVGGVIGKGGTIVKNLENETGASIIVGPSLADCDERLITVTAMESIESQYSPAQNGAVLVFTRSTVAGIVKRLDSDPKGPAVSARVVVPSNQVGCLLGKGGAVIEDMRKVSGADLRIIGGNQVPKCALENNEVIQITGEFVNVRDALYKVTGRLRDNMFSINMTSGYGNRTFSRTDNSAYSRVRDAPPFGSHSSLGMPENCNELKSLTRSVDRLTISNNTDRPSPNLMSSNTGARAYEDNTLHNSDSLSSVKGAVKLASGSRSAIVMNTTVEIAVSDTVIGSIYGENGHNLARLREISGAKVTVHNPRPGTTQRTVVISGTPDETQAAQSLLQAFILG